MKDLIEDIIQKYSASIFKICLGYSNSFEDAEDLLQEVCVNIWKGLSSFRAEANIKTWIYRITVNTCLLKLRKKTIQTTSLDKLNEAWLAERQQQAMNEQLQILLAQIQALPEKDKLIMLLYLEELSHKEIATIIGIKPNYVGVKINRIKAHLVKKIKG